MNVNYSNNEKPARTFAEVLQARKEQSEHGIEATKMQPDSSSAGSK